ncbi:Exodeoxyribonuclease 7 large subunit [Arsenophonus endosymbiont of Bemisia tabaci Q2]|nr:Exodeoxyribonuclease 7 large subunit [Arsenophonus endosymbiont of Bemisia tabaci Q2]
MLASENSGIYSVSQLNQSVRQLLELQIGRIWLNAEISNFSQPASYHWHFTLKDEKAHLHAAMFRGQNIRVNFRPQNDQQVLVRATVTMYEPRGEYQLIIENMQPAGDGILQQ